MFGIKEIINKLYWMHEQWALQRVKVMREIHYIVDPWYSERNCHETLNLWNHRYCSHFELFSRKEMLDKANRHWIADAEWWADCLANFLAQYSPSNLTGYTDLRLDGPQFKSMPLQNYKLLSVVNFEHMVTVETWILNLGMTRFYCIKMLLFTWLLHGNHSEIRILNLKCLYFHSDSRYVDAQSKCSIQVFTKDIN